MSISMYLCLEKISFLERNNKFYGKRSTGIFKKGA